MLGTAIALASKVHENQRDKEGSLTFFTLCV